MKYKVDFNYNMAVVHLKQSDFSGEFNQLIDEELFKSIVVMPLIVILFTDADGYSEYQIPQRQVINDIPCISFVFGGYSYLISAADPYAE